MEPGERVDTQKDAGHRSRLKEKFLSHGISGFTDTDVIEMLLIFGTLERIANNRHDHS